MAQQGSLDPALQPSPQQLGTLDQAQREQLRAKRLAKMRTLDPYQKWVRKFAGIEDPVLPPESEQYDMLDTASKAATKRRHKYVMTQKLGPKPEPNVGPVDVSKNLISRKRKSPQTASRDPVRRSILVEDPVILPSEVKDLIMSYSHDVQRANQIVEESIKYDILEAPFMDQEDPEIQRRLMTALFMTPKPLLHTYINRILKQIDENHRQKFLKDVLARDQSIRTHLNPILVRNVAGVSKRNITRDQYMKAFPPIVLPEDDDLWASSSFWQQIPSQYPHMVSHELDKGFQNSIIRVLSHSNYKILTQDGMWRYVLSELPGITEYFIQSLSLRYVKLNYLILQVPIQEFDHLDVITQLQSSILLCQKEWKRVTGRDLNITLYVDVNPHRQNDYNIRLIQNVASMYYFFLPYAQYTEHFDMSFESNLSDAPIELYYTSPHF